MPKLRLTSFVYGVVILCIGCFVSNGSNSQPLTAEFLKERDRLATVYITCNYLNVNREEIPCESGSGVIVTNDGYIVTARHVIKDWLSVESDDWREKHPIEAHIGSNNGAPVKLELQYPGLPSAKDDIVLLKALDSSHQYKYAPICFSGHGKGAAIALGYPNGKDLFGITGVFGDNNGEDGFWTASISIDHGVSGGPVYDELGNVVALSYGVEGMSATPTYLIPLRWAREILTSRTDAQSSCSKSKEQGNAERVEALPELPSIKPAGSVGVAEPLPLLPNINGKVEHLPSLPNIDSSDGAQPLPSLPKVDGSNKVEPLPQLPSLNSTDNSEGSKGFFEFKLCNRSREDVQAVTVGTKKLGSDQLFINAWVPVASGYCNNLGRYTRKGKLYWIAVSPVSGRIWTTKGGKKIRFHFVSAVKCLPIFST
jgi:hypothetical protein